MTPACSAPRSAVGAAPSSRPKSTDLLATNSSSPSQPSPSFATERSLQTGVSHVALVWKKQSQQPPWCRSATPSSREWLSFDWHAVKRATPSQTRCTPTTCGSLRAHCTSMQAWSQQTQSSATSQASTRFADPSPARSRARPLPADPTRWPARCARRVARYRRAHQGGRHGGWCIKSVPSRSTTLNGSHHTESVFRNPRTKSTPQDVGTPPFTNSGRRPHGRTVRGGIASRRRVVPLESTPTLARPHSGGVSVAAVDDRHAHVSVDRRSAA